MMFPACKVRGFSSRGQNSAADPCFRLPKNILALLKRARNQKKIVWSSGLPELKSLRLLPHMISDLTFLPNTQDSNHSRRALRD